MGDFVVVKNIDQIKVSGKKMEQKKYFQHSGYLGSWREISFEKIFKKNPEKVLKIAVLGMLPKNKLRKKMIKRLKIE
jgi:large subunit ribosomal protein L13